MKKGKKSSFLKKMKWFFIGVIATIGFIYIPPAIEKYGNKVYKKTLKTDDIDFDDMGPEIITFDDYEKED